MIETLWNDHAVREAVQRFGSLSALGEQVVILERRAAQLELTIENLVDMADRDTLVIEKLTRRNEELEQQCDSLRAIVSDLKQQADEWRHPS